MCFYLQALKNNKEDNNEVEEIEKCIKKAPHSIRRIEQTNNFDTICISTRFDSKHCKSCCVKDSIWLKISQAIYDLVENQYFEFFIIFTIILSSIALVI